MRIVTKKILTIALFLAAGTGFLFASDHVVFQQFYPVTSVDGVNIDLMSEEVEIALWNRNEFRVTIVSYYNDYPSVSLSGNVLSCVDKSGGSRHQCKVEIKVPESFYAKAAYGGWSISTMSGSITASKLWGDNISVDTLSGTVMLSKCEAQMVDVESSSGKVTLSQCIVSELADLEAISGVISFDGIASGINAETTSGSINISLNQPLSQDCIFESISGAITLSMPDNPGFKLVFDTLSGSIFNAFSGYSGGKSGIDSYGAGYVVIRAETSSGAIRILRK